MLSSIKRSAYVLPLRDECVEDMQWLLREIREKGGKAWLFASSVVAGVADQEIRDAFNAARASEYAELGERVRKLLETIRRASESGSTPARFPVRAVNELARLRSRLASIGRIDFFGAPESREVEALMSELSRLLGNRDAENPSLPGGIGELRGRTWVTRRGVEEDRIASAWLIRRFIDPAAQFRFADSESPSLAKHEIPFDMYHGRFTHRDGRVTFEQLLDHASPQDRALREIAEIIHDIDLKDERFGRPEGPGIAMAIEGIVLRSPDDRSRLDQGFILLDALYERLRSDRASEQPAGGGHER